MEQINTCPICKNIIDTGVMVHEDCAKDANAFYVKMLAMMRVANNALAMMRKQYRGWQSVYERAAHVLCDEKQTKTAEFGMSLTNQTATELKIIIEAIAEIVKNYEGENTDDRKFRGNKKPYYKNSYGRVIKRLPRKRY